MAESWADDKRDMVVLSIHLIAPGVWKSGEYLRRGCPANQRWTREKCSGVAAACMSPRMVGSCNQAGDRESRAAQLGSAQFSDGSGHAAQDCDMTEGSERGVASSRSRAGQCFNRGPREGGPTTPGSWEMSADETKGRRPNTAMSNSRLVRPKHRIDSVLPRVRAVASLANGMADNLSA